MRVRPVEEFFLLSKLPVEREVNFVEREAKTQRRRVRQPQTIGGAAMVGPLHPELANCEIYRGVHRQEVNQSGNLQHRDALLRNSRQRQPLPGVEFRI